MSSQHLQLKKAGRLILFLLKLIFTALLLLITYFACIVLTNGYGQGKLSALLALLVTLAVFWCYKKRRWLQSKSRFYSLLAVLLVFTAFVIYTIIPVASNNAARPAPDFAAVSTKYWNLPTGSRIAYYKIAADKNAAKKSTPIIFIHGGPSAYVRLLDLNFFKAFAKDGYDVYLYDQAGSGRSGLLPKQLYSHERNIRDCEAIMDKINSKKYILIGQSYGGALLAHLMARPQTAKRVAKAIYVEPGNSIPEAEKQVFAKAPNALNQEVNVPLRLFLGLILKPQSEFTSQNETNNYVISHPGFIQSQFLQSFSKKDANRVPKVETSILNFSITGIVTREVTSFNPKIAQDYKQIHVPSMLMLGASSYIERNAPMDLLRINPSIERVQYFTNTGHILWNGLDNNNELVKRSIDAFLNNQQPSLPNYPQRKDIDDFLKARL